MGGRKVEVFAGSGVSGETTVADGEVNGVATGIGRWSGELGVRPLVVFEKGVSSSKSSAATADGAGVGAFAGADDQGNLTSLLRATH